MLPQDGAESGLSSESIPALISSEKLPQVGAELLSIPWGHIKLLIDKCKSEPQKGHNRYEQSDLVVLDS